MLLFDDVGMFGIRVSGLRVSFGIREGLGFHFFTHCHVSDGAHQPN